MFLSHYASAKSVINLWKKMLNHLLDIISQKVLISSVNVENTFCFSLASKLIELITWHKEIPHHVFAQIRQLITSLVEQ